MNDSQIQPEAVNGTHFTTIPASSAGPSTQIHCDTPAGAAWLRKYEHPPCDRAPEYCGVPDYNNTPSVHPEYKTISQISTFFTSGDDTHYFNKILLLHTSSAVAPVFYWRIATDGTFGGNPSTILNSNINIADWVTNNSSARIAYKSSTISLNATDFSNQGVVTTASFRPNLRQENVGNLVRRLLDAHRFDDVKRLLRIFNRGNPFPDPKRGALPLTDFSIEEIQQFFGDAWAYTVLLAGIGVLPLNGTAVSMMSPNAVSSVARDGAFVVQRFDQPIASFKDFNLGNRESVGVGTQSGSPCFVEMVQPNGTVTLAEVEAVGQPGNPTNILDDVAWFDLTWSYTLFEGLSVGPAGAGATAVPPYLTVKTITGVEMQPLSGSATSPFITNSAMVDEAALRIASMNNHARLDSLPAAANFWGSLGRVLLKAAPTVISTVSSLFGRKQTKKQAETTKSTASNLIGKIADIEKRLAATSIREPRQPRRRRPPPTPISAMPVVPPMPAMAAPPRARRRRRAAPTAIAAVRAKQHRRQRRQ